MNSFDLATISFLNGFAQKSWAFDKLMVFAANSMLLRGGIFLAVVWALWFSGPEDRNKRRVVLLSTMLASFFALFTARVAALSLPFRARPLHTPELAFQLPYEVGPATLDAWSSFPSDHATLFFSLATGIFLASRRMGIIALLYTFVMIAFPRVYLGLHFPTDIIAGAFLGSAVMYVSNSNPIVKKLMHDKVMNWHDRHPAVFYAAFFLLTFEIAILFHDVRKIGGFVGATIKRVFNFPGL